MEQPHNEILEQLQALTRQVELLGAREIEAIRAVAARMEEFFNEGLKADSSLISMIEREVPLEAAAERAAKLLAKCSDPRAAELAEAMREYGQIPRRARARTLRERFPQLDPELAEGPPGPLLSELRDMMEDDDES
jgi:hypothetical protein